jgi:RimJ/RimL family protein N-acetyltransferase
MTSTLCADDLRTEALPTPYGHVVGVLRDGGVVVLRPLGRGEIGPQVAVLDRMSDESRWQRFLTAMPARLPRSAQAALAAVDGHRHVAWLASVDGSPAGVARSVEYEPGTAEVAFEVVDAHHGRGIGSLLLEAVTTVAACHGVRRLSATVHPGNLASVRLLHHVGVRLRAVDGLLEGTSELRLPTPARLDRAAVLTVQAGYAERHLGRDLDAAVG